MRIQHAITLITLASTLITGCNNPGTQSTSITIDGSSTVFPITEAIAEEFQKQNPTIRVSVGTSGTGGGFKKFAHREIHIADASRPIKPEEATEAAKNGIEFIEIPIAYDGISIVVNPRNTWATYLTTQELKQIWQPASTINNWKQIRNTFPDKPLKLYGAGTDSGTFDYFTEAIVGKARASRPDYTASEDDNTLVQGVAGDEGALGYFGYAYYEANKDKVKLLAIDNGKGPVLPSPQTINDGSYQPLSRPVFLYIRKDAAELPHVQQFIRFYLTQGPELIKSVGYIPLPPRAYQLALQRFQQRKTGSLFARENTIGIKIEELMAKEAAN
ncbi:MAG: PstS family phosphate ABC transporter substrate-binding protein [Chloroherpetonaceae bacterium]|nr:PstS family phosphate ABC transporter substrate-binding protein [Chloroherpetonaceae bacterium]